MVGGMSTTSGTAGLTPEQMEAAVVSLATPDLLPSPFGELRFFDGVPLPETVATIYDALDLMRGIEVFLNCVPGASLVAMRRGFRSVGVDGRILGLTDPRAGSGALFLTPNTETTYGSAFVDLHAWGPTVIEAPPMGLCVIDDFWFRYVADMGIAGPDKGAGGKYLLLPPGHEGTVPDGYFVCRSPTFTNWVVLRALGGVEDLKRTRIYPLADAAAPPANEWFDFTVPHFNTVHANDFGFFEEIDELIQEEPTTSLDPERAGQLAAIGIVHGTPFAPDAHRRQLLDQAARIGAGIARTIAFEPRDPAATISGHWKQAFVGGSHEFLRDGARLLDARTMFHYIATVITPAMAHAQVGAGSAYAVTVHDAGGAILDGGKTYRLHVDPEPPAKNFWSADVYDTQTRSLLQVPSTLYPALASNTNTLVANDDGSYDLWFGPEAPAGREANWVQTLPGRSWFTIFRLYGPLQPWFDQTWTLNELEPVG
jgi:hypothetical protein